MNIHLEINAAIIKKMNSYHITNDILGSVLFILIGLYEGKIELLDELDDYNRKRRIILLYRMLERLNLIELSDEDELSLYCLTKEGTEVVEFVKKEFIHTNHTSLTTEVVAKEKLEIADENGIETWIEEWINLFPNRKHGRTFKCHPQDAILRMKEFMSKHGYDKDTIIAATKRYVKEGEEEADNKYTMEALYFIYKGKGQEKASKLSSVCYEYVSKGQEKEINNNFRDVV